MIIPLAAFLLLTAPASHASKSKRPSKLEQQLQKSSRPSKLEQMLKGTKSSDGPGSRPADEASPAPDGPATQPSAEPRPRFRAQASSRAASQPASSPVMDAQTSIRLHAVEERVNDLKEKIFRSKARLVLLQEAVLHGTIIGARAVLIHKNDMGGSFRLEEAQYALDGAPIYSKTDAEGGLDAKSEFEIFNGAIVPGAHQISVYLVYRGNGFGVFSYLKDYSFKIKSSYTFTAEEGKQTTVKIVGFEKGGLMTELKDRPAVRYDVEVQKELRLQKPPPGDATPPPAEKK